MEGNETSNKTQSVSDDKNVIDLFLLEVVDNEILCVCNPSNTGLDNKSELVKLLKEQNGKSLFVDRKWTDCKSRDCGTCMVCTIDKY